MLRRLAGLSILRLDPRLLRIVLRPSQTHNLLAKGNVNTLLLKLLVQQNNQFAHRESSSGISMVLHQAAVQAGILGSAKRSPADPAGHEAPFPDLLQNTSALKYGYGRGRVVCCSRRPVEMMSRL